MAERLRNPGSDLEPFWKFFDFFGGNLFFGLLVCWVVLLLGSWILELLGCFVSGLLGCWVVWLSVGCWVVGLLGCWVIMPLRLLL